MLAEMKREVFVSLEHSELGLFCLEPILAVYKKEAQRFQGTEHEFKSAFYKQMSPNQRALFMFYAYFNHAQKSAGELYWWSAYYLAQPQAWTAIKKGMDIFGTEEMLSLAENIEQVLRSRNAPEQLGQFKSTFNDLEKDRELRLAIEPLYTKLLHISHSELKKIGCHIRANRHDYIRLTD